MLSGGDSFIVILTSNGTPNFFNEALLAGQAGSLIELPGDVIAQAHQGNSEICQGWKFDGVTDNLGTLEFDAAASGTRRMAFSLLRVQNYQVLDIVKVETGQDAMINFEMDVAQDEVVLTAFGKGFHNAPFTDLTGFTPLQNVVLANRPLCLGWHQVQANEPGRAFSVDAPDRTGQRNVAFGIKLGAA